MGPKPSVQLAFAELENQLYYVTLLSKEKGSGSHTVGTRPLDKSRVSDSEHPEDDLQAWQAFRGYQDADGFYFFDYFKRCNEENTFALMYFPPSVFKVLLYFPAQNHFAVSYTMERYAVDSYFAVSLSASTGALTVRQNYDYTVEAVGLAARIVLTIAVELLVALAFGLRKKNILLFVLVVNIVTQVILNLLLNIINYQSGGLAFRLNYLWMESVVVLMEAVLFSCYFKRCKEDLPIGGVTYAVFANTSSFLTGVFMASKLEGIF